MLRYTRVLMFTIFLTWASNAFCNAIEIDAEYEAVIRETLELPIAQTNIQKMAQHILYSVHPSFVPLYEKCEETLTMSMFMMLPPAVLLDLGFYIKPSGILDLFNRMFMGVSPVNLEDIQGVNLKKKDINHTECIIVFNADDIFKGQLLLDLVKKDDIWHRKNVAVWCDEIKQYNKLKLPKFYEEP